MDKTSTHDTHHAAFFCFHTYIYGQHSGIAFHLLFFTLYKTILPLVLDVIEIQSAKFDTAIPPSARWIQEMCGSSLRYWYNKNIIYIYIYIPLHLI